MQAMQWLGSVKQQLQQQATPKQQKQQLGEEGSTASPADLPGLDIILQMAVLALLSHPLPAIKVSCRKCGKTKADWLFPRVDHYVRAQDLAHLVMGSTSNTIAECADALGMLIETICHVPGLLCASTPLDVVQNLLPRSIVDRQKGVIFSQDSILFVSMVHEVAEECQGHQ